MSTRGSVSIEPVGGRSCDGCYMCCKLYEITALNKPKDVWCSNCEIGVGCKIYATRPEVCRQFLCGYMIDPNLDMNWKPSVSKFVLLRSAKTGRVSVYVEENRRDAWRKEPYYSQLKKWSQENAMRNEQVVVYCGTRTLMILPTKDVDFGEVPSDERIVTQWVGAGANRRFEAFKWHKDDPRVPK